MLEVFEERKLRRNGKATYVNVPRTVLDAMGLSWQEFWNMPFMTFRVKDGKATIELEKR